MPLKQITDLVHTERNCGHIFCSTGINRDHNFVDTQNPDHRKHRLVIYNSDDVSNGDNGDNFHDLFFLISISVRLSKFR